MLREKKSRINLWCLVLILWCCATHWSMYGKHCHSHQRLTSKWTLILTLWLCYYAVVMGGGGYKYVIKQYGRVTDLEAVIFVEVYFRGVTHRSKPSTQWYKVRVILQVEQFHLLNRSLTGGETPRLRQNLKCEREREKKKRWSRAFNPLNDKC